MGNEKGIGLQPPQQAECGPCTKGSTEAAQGSSPNLNQLWPAQNHSCQKWVFWRGYFFPFPSRGGKEDTPPYKKRYGQVEDGLGKGHKMIQGLGST